MHNKYTHTHTHTHSHARTHTNIMSLCIRDTTVGHHPPKRSRTDPLGGPRTVQTTVELALGADAGPVGHDAGADPHAR